MQRGWVIGVSTAAAAGVAGYVTAWAVAGWWREGYDPARQAISELFALDAPPGPARLVVAALVVTGVLLVAFAPALHVGLPGHGTLGPVLAAVSGVATVLIVAFPCTAGCPGAGTSLTDSMHTWMAGIGYTALILAPLAFAWRLRRHAPGLALASLVLGGLAATGFVVRVLGVTEALGGLQQRVFNTAADAWYVVAAVDIVRRERARGRHPAARRT